jgi:shikimate 5-dehydrogenase
LTRRLRFSLLGHPVRHSVSPAMCTAAFAALGLPHVYTAIDVPGTAGLGRIVDDLRAGLLAGCNITVPYKRAVLALADARAESAEEAGAANVLAVKDGRVVAHNTDADALARDIEAVWADQDEEVVRDTVPDAQPIHGGAGSQAHPGPRAPAEPFVRVSRSSRPPAMRAVAPHLRAAIIGSGGAALAALVACRRLGFKVVCMTSRSWVDTETMFEAPSAQQARALGALTAPWPRRDEAAGPSSKLSQALRLQWGDLAANADCIIQATSAGMTGADPGEEVSAIVPWDRLAAHSVAYDVVYNPRVTPFLRAARSYGLTGVDGLGMLVRQAALSIALWTGLTPPLDRMRAAAEAALDEGYPRR